MKICRLLSSYLSLYDGYEGDTRFEECLNCFVLEEDAAIAAYIDVLVAGCLVNITGVIFEKATFDCIQDQFVEVVNVLLVAVEDRSVLLPKVVVGSEG